jgi:hypothetical protein
MVDKGKPVLISQSVTSTTNPATLDIPAMVLAIRGYRVLLAQQLAALYGVETRVLMQQVQRNAERFPADFMFQLRAEEFANLKSQIVTSSWGGIRKLPYAFTEQGVAMLSSVLRSERAVAVNIQIMRAFVKLRSVLSEHAELRKKLAQIEEKYDEHFRVVFDAIRQLMTEPVRDGYGSHRIGFTKDD